MQYRMSIMFILLTSVSNLYVYGEDNDDFPYVEMTEMYMGVTEIENETLNNNPTSVSIPDELTTENPFLGSNNSRELTWLKNAIKDTAYYLRSYKFSEYDRRYNIKEPKELGQYFLGYPKPPLRSLHWEVHKHCDSSFIKCMEYLHRRVQETILKRKDDTSFIMNEQQWDDKKHELQINSTDADCRKLRENDNKYGLPFERPLERFQWRTTASYYMCWYTMNGVPDLEYFGESCDNFANCLERKYGANNLDPRASDTKPFFCSLYSLCPDPCCPMRHIETHASCYESVLNPCYEENQLDRNNLQCRFDRHKNTDFNNIILNRWNHTCHCQQNGYQWDSKYGICIDINECALGTHSCDTTKEFCLNLPGTYKCSCNWGYIWDNHKNSCEESPVLSLIKKRRKPQNSTDVTRKKHSFLTVLKDLYYKLFERSS